MFRRSQHISIMVMLLFSFTPTIAQVGMPDTVCVGTSRIYRVNDATVPSTYTWKINGVPQNSSTHEISITWNNPGIFQLTVQEHASNGCDGDIRSGTVYVNPLPVANAGPDIIVCFGENIRLNGSGGAVYQWSPSAYLSNPRIANPVAAIPAAGTYKYVLAVSSNGCSSLNSDTVIITMLAPVRVFAGNDTAVTINQPLQLQVVGAGNSGFINYSWSPSFGLNNPSISNPVAVLANEITYKVTARTADGCEAGDDITIKVFQKADIYVPTAFTPNGDGLNDIFKVIPVGIKEFKYLKVFNRWGELVFATTNASQGWNGTYKGQQQGTFVFVWEAKGIDYLGNTISRKGTVTLIR